MTLLIKISLGGFRVKIVSNFKWRWQKETRIIQTEHIMHFESVVVLYTYKHTRHQRERYSSSEQRRKVLKRQKGSTQCGARNCAAAAVLIVGDCYNERRHRLWIGVHNPPPLETHACISEMVRECKYGRLLREPLGGDGRLDGIKCTERAANRNWRACKKCISQTD